jgi:hypothetical protein
MERPEEQQAQLVPRSWFLTPISDKRHQGSLDKWQLLGLGQKHPVMPKMSYCATKYRSAQNINEQQINQCHNGRAESKYHFEMTHFILDEFHLNKLFFKGQHERFLC